MRRVPCEAQTDNKVEFAQTYVIQYEEKDSTTLVQWGRSQLTLHNMSAFASVTIDNEFFAVVTYPSSIRTVHRYQKIREELKEWDAKF